MAVISSFPVTPHDFETSEFRKLFDHRLTQIIKEQKQNKKLLEALKYVTQSGGKLIRPRLLYEFAYIDNPKNKTRNLAAIIDCSIALELIHTYSLIHDDLPAMDNALLRRGHPTCWSRFDEATAILVGDALIPLAFEILSQLPETTESIRLALITLISKIIGANGLVAGQMMDLNPPKDEQLTEAEKVDWVEAMQILKTGVLLGGACASGIILAGYPEKFDAAIQFGEHLGLLYQITDDLLDHEGHSEITGKTVQNDGEKMTFITLMGIENVRKITKDLNEYLKDQIKEHFFDNKNLSLLLDTLTQRKF